MSDDYQIIGTRGDLLYEIKALKPFKKRISSYKVGDITYIRKEDADQRNIDNYLESIKKQSNGNDEEI